MTVSQLLDRVSHRLGLADYGDARFAEGLEILIKSFDLENDISVFGHILIKTTLQDYLRSRLLIHQTLRLHPEISQESIHRPLFIVGMNRTGTTLLHNLLALAADTRAPKAWEIMKPAPLCAPESPEEKRRMRRAARSLWLLQRAAPGLRAAHPIKASDYEECYPLVNRTFASPAFSLHFGLPRYTEWLKSLDLEAERWVYREYRAQLQILQTHHPKKRWILKSAVHLYFLRALLEEFPHACFVQTHRDPLDMVPSLCRLIACFRRLVYSRFSEGALGREILGKIRDALERGRSARAGAGDDRTLDIEFDDLVADPVGQVRRIHDHFDLGWDNGYEQRMRSWMARSSNGRRPGHRSSIAQFGLDEAMIRSSLERFLPHDDPSLRSKTDRAGSPGRRLECSSSDNGLKSAANRWR